MSNEDASSNGDYSPDVLVAGETLVDFLPDSTGSLADVQNFSKRAGGAPANVAVGLAHLDVLPWFWTRVGADPFGDFLVRTLEGHGLSDRFVERDPEAKTTLAFVSHDENADRAFTFYRDGTADTRVEPGAVPDDVLDGVSWVYVGGVMLAEEPGRTATLDLAERATDRDCTVVFDPNARPELWSSDEEFAEAVGEMLDYADVVKATPEDLDAAGFDGVSEEDGVNPEALAQAVCDAGPHTVLLTLGDSGSFAYSTDRAPWGADAASHGGYTVEPTDTTGAGDAFTAGALAALADDELGGSEISDDHTLSSVLGFANAVAAVTTTAAGAMTALPTREEVRRFRDLE
ncbi:carbohydrate kinase family protein [Halorussus halophilus]|uniref:carbohydrate kinase family protein n=1 Tax=Halorussus halophilus TaxID=2650975 RepID=UPI0013010DF6|nr:carbohydrate kinase [Halorussus halophilus]